jgi:hypothetical protein
MPQDLDRQGDRLPGGAPKSDLWSDQAPGRESSRVDGPDQREESLVLNGIMLPSREATMFEQAVQFSEAFHQGAGRMRRSLVPALKGCPHCNTVQMIASPSLGTCVNCGAKMTVLGLARA